MHTFYFLSFRKCHFQLGVCRMIFQMCNFVVFIDAVDSVFDAFFVAFLHFIVSYRIACCQAYPDETI